MVREPKGCRKISAVSLPGNDFGKLFTQSRSDTVVGKETIVAIGQSRLTETGDNLPPGY